MVFLRPTILRDTKKSAFVTNEKYNLLRSLQIQANDGELEDNPIQLPEIKQPKEEEVPEENTSFEDDDDSF